MSINLLGELWDTTRMRLLVEVDRRGSLSAAAQEVGIGQPSASQHLRTLETAAGQRLVERNGRGSRLTEAGRVLATHAAQALAALAAGEQELGALAGLRTGVIRLGASTAVGSYLLPDALGCFRRECPGVDVEVEIAASGEILWRLLTGRIQLAIVGVDKADERIALEPFLVDEIVGVAKPGLLGTSKGKLAPTSLAKTTLLSREPDSSSRGYLEAELREIDVEPARVWELGSPEALKRAAREGLGVAFLSVYAVAEEINRGELEVFRLRGRPPLRRAFHIARLASRTLSPAEEAFVSTLSRSCAKHEEHARTLLEQASEPSGTTQHGNGR
jgi:LysR family transcriptional regulator, low CO2-responsive transcriptional regulator